jgi:DNA-binding beta-propeller fold protein YncE
LEDGSFQYLEDCFNGLDDDGDGAVDSFDIDCGTSQPVSEDCLNGLDDDADGWIDSQDADCNTPPESQSTSPVEEVCGNDIDDNGDGSVDEGCAPPSPPPEEVCGNDIDDNGDGSVDEGCIDLNKQPPGIEETAPLSNATQPPGIEETAPLSNATQPPGIEETAPLSNATQPPGIEETKVGCFTTSNNDTLCTRIDETKQNAPPMADAGEYKIASPGEIIFLDGTKSFDSDGNIVSYSWSQEGGPTVTIIDADTPQPSFFAPSFSETSDLKFDLTIVDNNGAYDIDSVNISVNASSDPQELKNVSIDLNVPPEKIFYNDTYEFTGRLSGIGNLTGQYVEIKDDDSTGNGGTLAFDDIDESGNFAAEWYPGPETSNYTIFAAYQDSMGNIIKSNSYNVEIEFPSEQIENITDLDTQLPFIQISENPWIQRTLNVYIVSLDDRSSGFIDTARSAVEELSNSLRDSTGNYGAWDFRIIRSESVYKDPGSILSYPPNIMIMLEDKSCAREFGKHLGQAGPTDPFGIGKILNFRYVITTYTGSDCNYESTTVGQTVYDVTIHEMIHGLGIKHAWQEKGDLMCSAEVFDEQRYWTCQKEDGSDSEDNYNDDNKPSEFDLRAIRFIYGDNGFERPNPSIQPGELYYCEISPCERFVKQVDLGNAQLKESIANKLPAKISPDDGVTNEQNLSSTSQPTEEEDGKTIPNGFSIISSWGTFGSQNGQFDGSADVAVENSDNTVYVTDINNARVQKFSEKGKFLQAWGEKGVTNDSFNHPGDVATGGGYVYVSDINNNRIQKFDLEGKYIASWGSSGSEDGQFDHPGAIAVDSSDGTLYITDIGNHRVEKFSSDGKYLSSWGTKGKGDGQMDRPAGLAFDSSTGKLYVVDTNNNRIQIFDKNGNFINKWGSTGDGNGQFNRPTDITVDVKNKLVYVADTKNFRIQVFDTNGNFMIKFGSNGEGDQQFLEPTGVSLNSVKGLVYIADKEANRIKLFSVISETDKLVKNNSFSQPKMEIKPQVIYQPSCGPVEGFNLHVEIHGFAQNSHIHWRVVDATSHIPLYGYFDTDNQGSVTDLIRIEDLKPGNYTMIFGDDSDNNAEFDVGGARKEIMINIPCLSIQDGIAKSSSIGKNTFAANLSSMKEVPPIHSDAWGRTTFWIKNGTISYKLEVYSIDNVATVHLHLGEETVNGDVVATLFTSSPTGTVDGVLKEGTIDSEDLTGPLEGKTKSDLVDLMNGKRIYVNVKSVDFPDGEIRGTIARSQNAEIAPLKVEYDECAENGNIAPCIDEHGTIVFYCDDQRYNSTKLGATCMPSPQDWASFLPECNSVNFESSCSGPQGPYFTCDDPEFHIEKYAYGCLENGRLTITPSVTPALPLPLAPPDEQAKYPTCDLSHTNANLPCLANDGSITFDCNDERFLSSKFAAGCIGS